MTPARRTRAVVIGGAMKALKERTTGKVLKVRTTALINCQVFDAGGGEALWASKSFRADNSAWTSLHRAAKSDS